MATWIAHVEQVKKDPYPFKAFAACRGKRQSAGEFLDQQHADLYARMLATQLTFADLPAREQAQGRFWEPEPPSEPTEGPETPPRASNEVPEASKEQRQPIKEPVQKAKRGPRRKA